MSSTPTSDAVIWTVRPTLDELNEVRNHTMIHHIGIQFTEVGNDYLRATMPVDERTVQPLGLLHGGASVALAETLGSVGALYCVDPAKQYGVGLEINANHVRSARSGHVTGTARPVHIGRTTHVWQILIEDQQGRLVSISRITLAIMDRRS